MRPMLAFLGGAFIVLGLLGVPVASWLGFIDAALGCAAILAAALLRRGPGRYRSRAMPLVIGIVTLGAFVLGLVFDVAAWLTWWTFAFGCAFLLAPLIPPAERAGPGAGGSSDEPI